MSPTAEGFRAAFRRPSLTLAEISWRWIVGATAAAVCGFGLVEYLDTLPVTNGELLFLRSRQPYLVGEAIAHILRGSLNRAVLAGILAAFLLAGLWMIAASVGRFATVRGLLEYFRSNIASGLSAGTANDAERGFANLVSRKEGPLRALARLNFLRVAATLAAILGLVGASIVASLASPSASPRPGLAFFLFLTLAALVCFVWSALNWLLSLAGIFVVREGDDAMAAMSAAVTLCRDRGRAVSTIGAWTGLAHLVAFVGATIVISMPLGLLALLSWRLAIATTILGILGYFALADWLYMARLAGYVCIIETPAEMPWVPAVAPPLQTTIDRNEPILSDLPNLIAGT
jgi:hypothetical protein